MNLLLITIFLYTINLMFIILNLLNMIKIYTVRCNLWVPVNPTGIGLGKILNLSRVLIF
jgi:hypothetical protein